MKSNVGYLILLVGLLSFSQQQANEKNTSTPTENEEFDYEGCPEKVDLECICCHLYGDQLKQCMQCLSSYDLITNFFLLNPRAQDYYLRKLNPRELKEFFKNLNSEETKKAIAHVILSRKVSKKDLKKGYEIIDSYSGWYNTMRAIVLLDEKHIDMNDLF